MTPKEYCAWAQEQIGPEYKVELADDEWSCNATTGEQCAFLWMQCAGKLHGDICTGSHSIVFVKAKK